MTLKEEIIELVKRSPGLTDREITDRLRGRAEPQQPINIACRELEKHGFLARLKNRASDSYIGNYPSKSGLQYMPVKRSPQQKTTKDAGDGHLSEDAIKEVLQLWLLDGGWKVDVAWGKQRGIDIEAFRGKEHWVIEVKGPGSRQPMRVNYFLAILGELLQRMTDERTAFSIALPDIPQYRRLWERLPDLAKRRTRITVLFVSQEGEVIHLER